MASGKSVGKDEGRAYSVRRRWEQIRVRARKVIPPWKELRVSIAHSCRQSNST
jgi:hypothetical protein